PSRGTLRPPPPEDAIDLPRAPQRAGRGPGERARLPHSNRRGSGRNVPDGRSGAGIPGSRDHPPGRRAGRAHVPAVVVLSGPTAPAGSRPRVWRLRGEAARGGRAKAPEDPRLSGPAAPDPASEWTLGRLNGRMNPSHGRVSKSGKTIV